VLHRYVACTTVPFVLTVSQKQVVQAMVNVLRTGKAAPVAVLVSNLLLVAFDEVKVWPEEFAVAYLEVACLLSLFNNNPLWLRMLRGNVSGSIFPTVPSLWTTC